ncbi:hypothetical protein ACHWQZ_G016096 [Mnemiopsis leidyi]
MIARFCVSILSLALLLSKWGVEGQSQLEREKKMVKKCYSHRWLPKLNKFTERSVIKRCKAVALKHDILGGTGMNMMQIGILKDESNNVIRHIARCTRPLPTANNSTYKNHEGCGPCEEGTLGVTCEECLSSLCNMMKPIKCFQGPASGNLGSPAECSDPSENVCSSPVGEASNVSYSCGPCPEGTKGTTCKECKSNSKKACNGPKKLFWEYKCATWEFDKTTGKPTKKKTDTVCKTGTIFPAICNRPSYTASPHDGDFPIIPTKLTYTNEDSCGPCKNDSIACAECDFRKCNDKIPIKCLQTYYGISKSTECDDRYAKKCRQPTFENYKGFSGLSYGCGSCPSGDINERRADGRCETCTGSVDSPCNTPPTLAPDFSCYSYTWDGRIKNLRDQYWVTETRCMRLPGVKAICNRPANSNIKGNYTLPYWFNETTKYTRDYLRPNGCGPCPEGTKRPFFNTCEDCEGEFCNKLPWEQDGTGSGEGNWKTMITLIVVSVIILFLALFLGLCTSMYLKLS